MEVKDLRGNGDPSLSVVPRITTYEELKKYANAAADTSKGWNAAPEGSLVWKLVGFSLQSGPASFVAKFLNEDGSPAKGIAVVHSWPGSPELPGEVAVVPDYSGCRGIIGFTKDNGEVGFAYSHGMLYTNKVGVGMIWPLVPTHLQEPKFADAAIGLGWFGGTDHLTVNPIFKLTRKSSTPTPEPVMVSYLRVVVKGQEIGVVPIVNRPAKEEGKNALEVYVDDVLIGEVVF